MQWEYLTLDWRFAGPDLDKWPGQERYAAGLAQQEEGRRNRGSMLVALSSYGLRSDRFRGEEGDRLGAEYVTWREDTEQEYLNEIGAAGYELVSVSREVTRQSSGAGLYSYAFPRIRCHAYFKREVVPNAPEPTRRRIGFQSGDLGNDSQQDLDSQ